MLVTYFIYYLYIIINMDKTKFNVQSLFNKAALLDICRKSPILRNIEYDVNTVTEA